MTHSQQRYTRQANKHRRAVDFKVGDMVWVTTKHQKSDRPSRKLAQQMDRPYEILEQIRHSFKLKLPESIKVHLVFHAKKLRKAPENPLPGQSNPKTLPLQVNNTEEYKVQRVLAVKLVQGKLKYRIHQKGWDVNPEWYLASTLSNSPIALQDFHTANPALPGPPKNLPYQRKCAEDDIYPDSRVDDGVPKAHQLAKLEDELNSKGGVMLQFRAQRTRLRANQATLAPTLLYMYSKAFAFFLFLLQFRIVVIERVLLLPSRPGLRLVTRHK